MISIASQVVNSCKLKFRGSAGFGDLHLIRDQATFLMRTMAFKGLCDTFRVGPQPSRFASGVLPGDYTVARQFLPLIRFDK